MMTTKLEQAARQLLFVVTGCAGRAIIHPDNEAITAMREALAEQAEQRSDSERMEPVASVEEWVARPHPEDIKRLEEQRSIGYWDSRLNDVCWHEGLINADLQHGQPLYGAPQPVQQEPVCIDWDTKTDEPIMGYAAPVRTKDLTDDEIMNLVRDECVDMRWPSTPLFIARAVIAADREKNRA